MQRLYLQFYATILLVLAAFVGAAGGNEDKATSAARALWLLAEKKASVPAPPAPPDAPPKRAKKDRDQ